MSINEKIRSRLATAPVAFFSAFAIAAAFTAYFCMYAFRKPYAVATYEGIMIGDVALKIALVTSQLIGYALSKCIGIKFLSEMKREYRFWVLLGLIAFAELTLVAFGVLGSYGYHKAQVVAMFFNGLPLGAIWGLVFSFLEGRQTSELLGAGLSCAYIVASGEVKAAGAFLMSQGIPQMWMPAATGLCFAPLFVLAAWGLYLLPPPSAQDVKARTVRKPMYGKERMDFIKRFFPGLFFLTILYVFLTAYRDFRDNFAPEIWNVILGKGKVAPAVFAQSERPIAFLVMLTLALLYMVKDNRKGFFITHYIMLSGTLLVGVSTWLMDAQMISGTAWMILVGLGLYLAYVPYGCVLFDRLIAAVGIAATAVFMIYVTDSAGYIGSIATNILKNYIKTSYYDFFRYFSYFISLFCSACFLGSLIYFKIKSKAIEKSSD